ncbi:MAG: hypothetical protein JRJ34_09655 [Deltaproteobacteria bacterium]|nr:hypothetical protein [Deltaproteobacteria bacterium]
MIELGDPYREMATTCSTRPMAEKKIIWKRFESEPFENGKFQAKVFSERFIDSAASVFRKAYPEVYGSPHEFVLMPERYPGRIALDENWEEDSRSKVYCMPVVVEFCGHTPQLSAQENHAAIEGRHLEDSPGFRGGVLYHVPGDLARHHPEVVHQGRLEGGRDFPGELRALEKTGPGVPGMCHPLLPFCP